MEAFQEFTPVLKVEKENTHVTLKVQRQKEHDIIFRVKRSTRLRKLMEQYSALIGVNNYKEIRFTNYDGRRIGENQTPDELEMEDMDTIDAWSEQIGAG